MNQGPMKGRRYYRAVFFVLPLLSLAATACGGSTPDAATDGGAEGIDSGRDAGGHDVGSHDAGSADAGGHDAGSHDAGSADAGGHDAGSQDAGSADAGGHDAGSRDAGSADAGQPDEHGFFIRKPQLRTLPCEGPVCPEPTLTLRDEDDLCTFKHGSINGFLYFQATPVKYAPMTCPEYQTVGTWVSVDGHATAVTGSYDPGGQHRNDSITFRYEGKDYRFYHSSFGTGWRVCQPMDCIQVLTGEDSEDGCGTNRSIPIVCVGVADDGTTPPLVDNFKKCP